MGRIRRKKRKRKRKAVTQNASCNGSDGKVQGCKKKDRREGRRMERQSEKGEPEVWAAWRQIARVDRLG